ncbi:MAG: molybdopterin molybdotransferase MoeA [Chloroflexi bacterium]|nr:molybdopterin molybdotransferase MoeA [Chloroflexota bacterium]
MINVDQALEHILTTVRVLEPERVPLLQATGRVLAETVTADRDIPPLTNSAMDGYAVRGADLEQADFPVRLRVVGEIAAGYVSTVQVTPGTAMRIMTGAPIPKGADTAVRFEDTRHGDDWVEVLVPYVTGRNVRAAGEDVREGQVVLEPEMVLRPQEIGMLAAVGQVEVSVVRRPRVAILATGDEVVPPDQLPGPGQIRDANSYAVAAQVQSFGGVPFLLGVARDQEELVRQGMRDALDQGADFIITSGGVSVGDFDLVKQVLAAEGAMHFWSLNMKPGRPLAFGVVDRVPLMGLPGNPVAAMLSTELFGRPAIMKMQGFTHRPGSAWPRPMAKARLGHPIKRQDDRRRFIRVRLQETDTGYTATRTGDQGSGILNSMVEADGLAVIPEGAGPLDAGAEVEVLLLPRVR